MARQLGEIATMYDTREIIVDSFAGGGGASLGIYLATGKHPDIAINHNEEAIRVHKANHPDTEHYTEDVWAVNPRLVTRGRKVGLLWASPDCKHHSRARGCKPVNKNIRSLAWVVCRWAHEVKPRVIILENVREFEEWGPVVPAWKCQGCGWRGTEGQATLVRHGKRNCPRCASARLKMNGEQIPDPAKKGITFKRFVGRLRSAGYAVEWQTLNAADFGAPTVRRRLFLVARRDGLPITWPEQTHADPKEIGEPTLFAEPRQPWKTAAECIDWSIPCPSIFLTKEEGKAIGVKRPLADKTLRRVAMGVKRYVIDNPKPFIVDMQRENRPRGVDEPMGTATTQGNRFNLCVPSLAPIAPSLINIERSYKDFAGQKVDSPLGTVTAKPTGGKHALVCPSLIPLTHQGERRGYSVQEPFPTVTGAHRGEIALVAPTLIQTGYGERDGQQPRVLDLESPLGTVVAGGQKHALCAAFLAKHFGGVVGHTPDRPIGTITAVDHHSVVAANLIHLNRGDKTATGCDEPMRTVTSQGNHAALVYAFLVKYFGTAIGVEIDAPLPTITGKDRFGLVIVWVSGEPYAIVDIGMRMLGPRELARCQSFPDWYLLPSDQLPGSKGSAVSMIGNSVPPLEAKAVVLANYATQLAEAI